MKARFIYLKYLMIERATIILNNIAKNQSVKIIKEGLELKLNLAIKHYR